MLQPLSSGKWDFQAAAHLLNRAGFGGSPDDIQKLSGLGHDQAVSSLIDYEKIPDPTLNPDWAKPDPARLLQIRDINQTGTPEQKKAMQQQQNQLQQFQMLELRG